MTNNEHAKPLDLDALESLLAKATKCEQDWRIDCKEFENANEAMADILRQDIAKLAPALIAELRELREDEALHVEVIGDLMAETTTLKAEIEKLRAYRDEVEATKPTVQALLNLGEVAASDRAWLRACLVSEQAARLREALIAQRTMRQEVKPTKLDAALNWRENDELAVLETLLDNLGKESDRKTWADQLEAEESDVTVDDFAGGNVDNAYQGGVQSGRKELAEELFHIIKARLRAGGT